MTQRERMLLLAVIGSAVIAAVSLGTRQVNKWTASRLTRIEQLEQQLEIARRRTKRGVLAAQTIKNYEERSLPSEPDLANSRYRDWLHHWLHKAEIDDHQVSFQSVQRIKGTYDKYTFSVVCQAELDQWVRLLYEFYRVDHLHRIKTMSVHPLKDGRLALGFTIDALALPGAKADKELVDRDSTRLAFGDLNAYLTRILNRNVFGPANQPPRFASDTTQNAYVGRPASLQIAARDPEGQAVHYRLIGELPGEYRLDETSGELRWTPPEKGEFEVTVVAEDEGVPPKRIETRLRIVVGDAPPEEAAPAFDVAKFTYLTAIVSVDGRPQIWLHNRPEDRLLKLFEGDEFQVGSYRGKVIRIEQRVVEIESSDKRWRLRPGQNLGEAEELHRDEIASGIAG